MMNHGNQNNFQHADLSSYFYYDSMASTDVVSNYLLVVVNSMIMNYFVLKILFVSMSYVLLMK